LDAKRIIPMLGTDPLEGLPVARARKLELAGADEILFLETGGSGDRGWIREVAGTLFIPFAVACAPAGDGDLAEILDAGADSVLFSVTPAELPRLAKAAEVWGRNALRLAVDLAWSLEQGWTGPEGRDGLDWLMELGQTGAGEILLSMGEEDLPGLEALCQGAARLPMPVLFQVAGWEVARDVLLHGADGVAFPVALGGPDQAKAFLGHAGLVLRH
jgi:hypothetical protein